MRVFIEGAVSLELVLKDCFSGENYFFACLPLRSKAAKKQFSPEKRSNFQFCEAFKTASYSV